MSRLDDLLREERRLMNELAEIAERIALEEEWRFGPPAPQPLHLVPPLHRGAATTPPRTNGVRGGAA